MFKGLFELDIHREEIHDFGKKIIHGDLYDDLQEIIPINKLEGRPYRTVWQENKWPQGRTKIFYASERELIKKVVLEIFNGSSRANTPEAIAFRAAFPSVHKIMAFIKGNDIEFYRLLSWVEAYCLLDYTAMQIGKKRPTQLLLSIHDSLVTTTSYVATFKSEMSSHLQQITGLTPTIKEENWLKQEVLYLKNESK